MDGISGGGQVGGAVLVVVKCVPRSNVSQNLLFLHRLRYCDTCSTSHSIPGIRPSLVGQRSVIRYIAYTETSMYHRAWLQLICELLSADDRTEREAIREALFNKNEIRKER